MEVYSLFSDFYLLGALHFGFDDRLLTWYLYRHDRGGPLVGAMSFYVGF
jgi:hypothetical protein